MAYKGLFKPTNPHKYKGNVDMIVWRSTWELKMMRWLDRTPAVIKWSSEEVAIPYRSPVDGFRVPHRYFPDFLFEMVDKQGKIQRHLIEVKPAYQTVPPKIQKKITPKYLKEVTTWGVNEAKWEAAEAFCKDRGWKFSIITEKELNIPSTTPRANKKRK